MSKIPELIIKWRKLPENIRRGQVQAMACKLGLGQRAVSVWMATDCQRWKDGKQWKYPRDVVITALLDKAGLKAQAGVSSVGAAGISEGAPGSNH